MMGRQAFVGATLVDGTGAAPLQASALVEEGRIAWVGRASDAPSGVEVVDVAGRYVIPGLMDANVHLVGDTSAERLLRYAPGEYDDQVLEGAQVALRAGITTVFDTWGALPPLRRVRDRIAAGEAVGARIFCAGNIIGMGGPWSDDFMTPESVVTQVVSRETAQQVNFQWEQGVGRELLWLSADDVRAAVREYIASSGIDFVKYSSSAHKENHYIAFAANAQRAICEEARAVGTTAQACTQTPEALTMAIDAGVDLLQHGDITGRRPMPDDTVELIVDRQLPCVAFLTTARNVESVPESVRGGLWREMMLVKHENDRRLIEAGAKLLLAWDMTVAGERSRRQGEEWGIEDPPNHLGSSHVTWVKAALEHGMKPMEALRSMTSHIAEAYGKLDDVGTLEPGKRADFVVLDEDPLADPGNYARVASVVQGGDEIDIASLPEQPVVTA
jgi:imidazolonepropionase-like amidohydrolase